MEKTEVLQLLCDRRKTDIFDLLYETNIPCAPLQKMLGEWVSEGKLKTEDGVSYTYIGKKLPRAVGGEKKIGKKERDDDLDVDALIEEMLREFEAEETGEDGQEAEEPEAEEMDPDTEDLDDDAPELDRGRAKYLMACMRESVYLETSGGEVSIGVRGLGFSAVSLKISPVIEDGQLYLSDRGRTLAYLSERVKDREELFRKAGEIARDCGVEVAYHGVLRIMVPLVDLTLAALVRMYEAIDRLLLLRSA